MRVRPKRRPPARPGATGSDPSAPISVLILSASMGAGHDGAANELAARLRGGGHRAVVRDFLDAGQLRVGAALRRGYEFELRHVPSAYDATYGLWYRVPWLCPVVARVVTAITRRRVLRWVRETGADVVVSTYPLSTLCLGRLRATNRLRVPAINFITDFGVHPLWVHRGIDRNLAVHEGPAAMAARRTGKPSSACGPAVSPAFDPSLLPDRAAARRSFGLREDDRAVLVVAGSWGVGGLDATWRALAADGGFTPVVVCGRDTRLRDEVTTLSRAAPGRSVVLGWTDQMPALMSACDALVENAGGLTSLEAMRAGLPVVSFEPIAGHGRENTAAMAAAGVGRLAADAPSLVAALAELTEPGPARRDQVASGRAMFRAEPAALVVDTAAGPRPPSRPGRPAVLIARAAAAILAVAALGWTGLTSGVAMAAEAGAGVAHPAAGSGPVAYIGVRLDAAELADPAVARQLRAMDVTAIVDNETAGSDPDALRALAKSGVDIASGGRGDWLPGDRTLWDRARGDAEAGRQLQRLVGVPVTVFVPGRRVNAWDLIENHDAHCSLVVPDHVLDAADDDAGPPTVHVTAHDIYLVNGLGATAADLDTTLARMRNGLLVEHLTAAPFALLA